MSEIISICESGSIRESSAEQFDQLIDLITENLAASLGRVYIEAWDESVRTQ